MDFQPLDRDGTYAFVARTLTRLDYRALDRPSKALVKRYLTTTTGYSRAQLTRLIRQHRETAKVVDRRDGNQGRPFARVYTPADVRLLARVDEDLGQMSGLATRVVLHREHHVFGGARFERLAGISASHIHDLRGSRTYRRQRTVVEGTRATTVAAGEFAERERFRLLVAAQDRAHARHQLGRRERLDDVVGRARLERARDGLVAPLGGDEDHRRLRQFRDLFQQLDAVPARQQQVEQHQPRPLRHPQTPRKTEEGHLAAAPAQGLEAGSQPIETDATYRYDRTLTRHRDVPPNSMTLGIEFVRKKSALVFAFLIKTFPSAAGMCHRIQRTPGDRLARFGPML